jgi:serpin B
MKKLSISLVLLTLVFSTGCSAIFPPTEPNQPTEDHSEGVTPAEPGMQMSGLQREMEPAVTAAQLQALADDNTAFALNFYEQLRSSEGNLIYSPFSISVALAMTMAGAEGDTRAAMQEALQLSLPIETLYPAYNALLLSIEGSEKLSNENAEGDPFTLNIANSIWGQTGYPFKEPFLNTLAQNFGAGMHTVDYVQAPEEARQAINGWVEEETHDKIKDLLPEGSVDALTRLVLANAIYFKGSWYTAFDVNATQAAPFTLLDGSQVDVDMMALNGEHLMYSQGNGFQVIQLPYMSTDFVMTLIVPDEGEFPIIENALSAETYQNWTSQLDYTLVNVQMPKFDFETSVNANAILVALGMGEAFDASAADFSGMTDADKLVISEVLHKATITVDESGTEAAAATAVVMKLTSAMPEDAIDLVMDRPFMFFIEHQPTGSVLFMGRVVEP